MDKNWITAAVEQVRGSIKEAIGRITGDPKLEAEGARARVRAKERADAAARTADAPGRVPAVEEPERHHRAIARVGDRR